MKASKLSCVIFIIIVLVIGTFTTLKVLMRHQDKLMKVASSKIEESARKCYLDGKCSGVETTLENLIKEGYLEQQIHPISKEYIDGSLVIRCVDFDCVTELKK